MPPRAPAMAPEARRAQLMAAAVEVLRAKGRAATTKQMADAAGVAEGTIFRVFENKEDLVDCALRKAFGPGEMLERLDAVDRDQPLRARLVDAVGIIQDRFVHIFDLMDAVGMVEPPEEVQSGREARSKESWQKGAMRRLVELVEPDSDQLRVPPADVVRLLRLLTFSGSHHEIADGDLLTPEEITDVILDGTRKGP